MKIIISPAKKMKEDFDSFAVTNMPMFLDKTKIILEKLKSMSLSELKLLWNCSDKIAVKNYNRLKNINLNKNLTPAICAYDGIQYNYMSPKIFNKTMLKYIQNNLLILSGFYGALKPFDGIVPYRLEMQAKTKINGTVGLYDFWEDDLYNAVKDKSKIIINLASKEYSKCIEKYLTPEDIFVTCTFAEKLNGKIKQKATYAKITRGEMVRIMAENNISTLSEIKQINIPNYKYSQEFSTENEYIFLHSK